VFLRARLHLGERLSADQISAKCPPKKIFQREGERLCTLGDFPSEPRRRDDLKMTNSKHHITSEYVFEYYEATKDQYGNLDANGNPSTNIVAPFRAIFGGPSLVRFQNTTDYYKVTVDKPTSIK
jgi:hypothetical protein